MNAAHAVALTAVQRDQRLARLLELANYYRRCAAVARNGGNLAADERVAQKYDHYRFALEWALGEIEARP